MTDRRFETPAEVIGKTRRGLVDFRALVLARLGALTAALAGHTHSGPLGVLGYAQVTANQGSLTTLVDLTGLSVAVDVADSRRIKVTLSLFTFTVSATEVDQADLYIREGSTTLQRKRLARGGATGNQAAVVPIVEVVLTPSAGVHTYKGSFARVVGATTWTLAAAADTPAFILVEDIGPA